MIWLERLPLRLQLTVVGSLAAHFLLLSLFGVSRFGQPAKRLELTEVEFQEEQAKPSEMEKLMNQLAAPKPAPRAAPRAAGREAAIAELERTSFRQVVGVKALPRKAEV